MFKLRGDFFMYPEDGFLEIEKFLVGKKVDESLGRILQEFIDEQKFDVFGFCAQDILDEMEFLS